MNNAPATKTVRATDLNRYSLFEHMQGRAVHTARVSPTSAAGIRRCIKAGLAIVVNGNLELTAEGRTAQFAYDLKAAPDALARAQREFERASVIADGCETRAESAEEQARAHEVVAKYKAEVESARAWVARMVAP